MENSQELLDALVQAGALVIPILAGILVYYLKGYLEVLGEKAGEQIGADKLDTLLLFVEMTIRAAAQAVDLDTDDKRKDYVVAQVVNLVVELGLPLSEEQVDDLIEGIYNRIKEEVNKPSE